MCVGSLERARHTAWVAAKGACKKRLPETPPVSPSPSSLPFTQSLAPHARSAHAPLRDPAQHAPPLAAMVSYRLHYFGIPGRAEAARLCFHIAGEWAARRRRQRGRGRRVCRGRSARRAARAACRRRCCCVRRSGMELDDVRIDFKVRGAASSARGGQEIAAGRGARRSGPPASAAAHTSASCSVPVPLQDWPAVKSQMPFRVVPVLEVDGEMLPQSAAIGERKRPRSGCAGLERTRPARSFQQPLSAALTRTHPAPAPLPPHQPARQTALSAA